MQAVSMVFGQTEILEKEVFLLDLLDNGGRQKMLHLKCLIFVRPTKDNIAKISAEIKAQNYSEYHLCLLFFPPSSPQLPLTSFCFFVLRNQFSRISLTRTISKISHRAMRMKLFNPCRNTFATILQLTVICFRSTFLHPSRSTLLFPTPKPCAAYATG